MAVCVGVQGLMISLQYKQNMHKHTPITSTSTKKRHPKLKLFFLLQTRRLSKPLTRWEPSYDIFVLRFWPKTSSCQLPYQRPSSFADCARELFKHSNGLDSLLDCTREKNFWLGVADFLWVTS